MLQKKGQKATALALRRTTKPRLEPFISAPKKQKKAPAECLVVGCTTKPDHPVTLLSPSASPPGEFYLDLTALPAICNFLPPLCAELPAGGHASICKTHWRHVIDEAGQMSLPTQLQLRPSPRYQIVPLGQRL